eukprot:577983-Amphidinium_carterae.1
MARVQHMRRRNDTAECLAPRQEVAKRQFENGLGRFFAKKAKTEATVASQVRMQQSTCKYAGRQENTELWKLRLPLGTGSECPHRRLHFEHHYLYAG